MSEGDAVMGTLARPHIDEADVMSVNNVKVVLDVHGSALYFSRALIPHNKKVPRSRETTTSQASL